MSLSPLCILCHLKQNDTYLHVVQTNILTDFAPIDITKPFMQCHHPPLPPLSRYYTLIHANTHNNQHLDNTLPSQLLPCHGYFTISWFLYIRVLKLLLLLWGGGYLSTIFIDPTLYFFYFYFVPLSCIFWQFALNCFPFKLNPMLIQKMSLLCCLESPYVWCLSHPLSRGLVIYDNPLT